METADIDYFRELLTAQLEELLNQARRAANDLINEEDHHYTEYVDKASFDEDHNLRLRSRNRESNLIKIIKRRSGESKKVNSEFVRIAERKYRSSG